MKNIIKKISTISILAVLFFSFISPFFVYAATPTIEFELFAEEQNGTTGYWAWVILVKTTNVPTGTTLNTYFYHGTNTGTNGTITTDSSGVATYSTGYTLLPSTTIQEEKYSLGVILNYNGTISKTFGPRATPSNGVVPDIIIQGDPNTTIGGGTPPQDPPTEFTPNKTTNTTTDITYKLLAPIGDFTEAPSNIGDYFNTIFKIAIGLCGALAVIMIIIGGIQYMGDESIFGKTEAKSKITAAILGLLIALGAFALLNTINPALLGGEINIKQVSAEIGGDTDTPTVLNRNILPTGIICSGDKSNIPNIAKSFSGKMTYEMGAKGVAGPNNTIKLDCSGFVNYVLDCASSNFVSGGTATIFNGAETVTSTSIQGTKINGVELEVGDLVGWRSGENSENFGHVMIYIGEGQVQVADSHSTKTIGDALGVFSITKYKDRIKYIKRIP